MVIIAVGILGYLTVKSLTGPSTGGGAPHFSINSGSLFGNSFNHDEFFPDTGDVAILNVTGVIFKSRPIIERIEELGEKKDLKAVVVRIDSPGGAVGPSQEILEAIQDLSKKLKVVCSFGDIAASGGYYIAAGCEKIVANPGTLTGSIGVIMNLVNLKGLYEWAKIQPQVLKAGRYKDMGSENRPLTDDEKKLFQNLLDSVHKQFQNSVKEARKLSDEQVNEYCDGRIFTGEEAKKLGFVDELGGEKKAIAVAAELAGITDEPTVIREEKFRNLSFPFFGRGLPWPDENSDEAESKASVEAFASALKSNLPLGKSLNLRPGVPYFLPSFYLNEELWK